MVSIHLRKSSKEQFTSRAEKKGGLGIQLAGALFDPRNGSRCDAKEASTAHSLLEYASAHLQSQLLADKSWVYQCQLWWSSTHVKDTLQALKIPGANLRALVFYEIYWILLDLIVSPRASVSNHKRFRKHELQAAETKWAFLKVRWVFRIFPILTTSETGSPFPNGAISDVPIHFQNLFDHWR
jgi:hypothetical protein